MKATLPLSAAGHAAIIALLLLLPRTMPSPPKIDLSNAVSVVFAPPAPPQPPPPQPVVEEPPSPPPPAAEEPPPPLPPPPVEQPPPPVEEPPPPPAPVAEVPPPPPPPPKVEPKPAPKPKPRPVQPVEQSRPVQPVEQPRPPLSMPLPLPLPNQGRPQVASIPPPAPTPTISSDYRTLLSGWLESHKRYPEEARQRGEEGRAVLRFRVDRFGRVLDYAVVGSTGFADLDAAVGAMMRGATLPPFPPGMSMPEIEVSVTIRFGLSR